MRIEFVTGNGDLTNLIVAESHALGLTQQVLAYLLKTSCSCQQLLYTMDVGQTAKEPLVNLGKVMQFVNGITLSERLLNSRQTTVCRIDQLSLDIGNMNIVADKSVQALTNHTHTLLDSLLEGASY